MHSSLQELEAQRTVHAESMEFLVTSAEDSNAESSGLTSEIMESLKTRQVWNPSIMRRTGGLIHRHV